MRIHWYERLRMIKSIFFYPRWNSVRLHIDGREELQMVRSEQPLQHEWDNCPDAGSAEITVPN